MEKVQKIRLVILGGEKVGKTKLATSILDGSVLEVEEDLNPNKKSSYENLSHSFIEVNSTQEKSLLEETSSSYRDEVQENKIYEKTNIRKIKKTHNSDNNLLSINSTGNSNQKTIEYKNKYYKVSILDSDSMSSGQSEFYNLKNLSDIQGFILVFSLDNELSFTTVQHINQVLISKVGFKYVPRVLVGNKCDLKHEISKERIKKLKNKMICPYVECSNEEGKNLDKILMKILKEIQNEANDEHPYDIVNANKELNTIGRNAHYFRQLLITLFIIVVALSFLLSLFDFISWFEGLEGKLFSIISFSCSLYTGSLGIICIKYSKNKEAEKMMKVLKFIYLSSLLNLIVIFILAFMSPYGSSIDYLTFFINMLLIFIQVFLLF